MREGLIGENLGLIRQGIGVLRGLDDEEYASADPRTGSAGIGGHVRHCIDFYQSFLRDAAGGRVDYDTRDRDPRLERDVRYAGDRMVAVAGRLESLDPLALPERLLVRMDASRELADRWAPSTPERELQFLASHTVHHYALIALRLKLDARTVPDGFGVATATLQYWESQSARGR